MLGFVIDSCHNPCLLPMAGLGRLFWPVRGIERLNQHLTLEISMLEAYEQLKALVASVEDDLRKAAGGNKAAGTRVRKQMQDVKNMAQALRVKVLENRDSD